MSTFVYAIESREYYEKQIPCGFGRVKWMKRSKLRSYTIALSAESAARWYFGFYVACRYKPEFDGNWVEVRSESEMVRLLKEGHQLENHKSYKLRFRIRRIYAIQ